MPRDEFLKKLDQLLELPEGTLRGGERLEELERWDSVALMEFIALADSSGSGSVSPRQLAGCATVEDLLKSAGVGR